MEKELLKLIEKAKTDKSLLVKLKGVAIDAGEYDLSSKLREIEKESFPETDEIKKIRDLSSQCVHVLGMVIYESMKVFLKKKDKFSINDSVEILRKKD